VKEMKWMLEEDVFHMLLHLMGLSPSLEEVLEVDEVDPLLLGRLLQRAKALGVVQQRGKEMTVTPAVQSLIRVAAEASEVVEVIKESSQLPHSGARCYYIGAEGMVAVETEDTKMLLWECAKEEACREITALIGVSETSPAASPIAIPVALSTESSASPVTGEEDSEFQDLVITGDFWWIIGFAQGRIKNSALVVTRGQGGWMLQEEESGGLVLWPTDRDSVESRIGQFFTTPPRG
jgi:hypothetical protein